MVAFLVTETQRTRRGPGRSSVGGSEVDRSAAASEASRSCCRPRHCRSAALQRLLHEIPGMAGFRPPGRDGWGLQRVGEQRHRGAFAGSNFSARHFDGRLPELSAREVYYLANLNDDGTTRARFRGHPTGLRNQGVTDFRPNLRPGIWLLPRLATYATNMNGAYGRT